ncbi:MAG TPA: hypothetical protein VKI18_15435 [Albitalea sp.]|nr:hypothetical protein [Albitalea sp.]
MRINPVPLLVAPGVALTGYVVDGRHGLAIGLGAWLVIVAGATGWAFVRHQRSKRHEGRGDEYGSG